MTFKSVRELDWGNVCVDLRAVFIYIGIKSLLAPYVAAKNSDGNHKQHCRKKMYTVIHAISALETCKQSSYRLNQSKVYNNLILSKDSKNLCITIG